MTELQKLTRDFSADIVSRALRDPEFQAGLRKEALAAIDRGELDVAAIILRDCPESVVKQS